MHEIFFVLEIIGTVAFAIAGAMAAIYKHLDIFGVLVCGLLTALGGGVTRDVLLGSVPPSMFLNYSYPAAAVIASLVTFIVAKILKEAFETKGTLIDRVNNIFDAIGLGVFTVAGINVAENSGYADNATFVIFLGLLTGCGGGILRDICIREIPFVFSKRIYAVASLAGGTVYYLMHITFSLNVTLSVICGVGVVFLLRLFASVFRWDLPKAY
jgi:uncharacterized membrane protein YeiH